MGETISKQMAIEALKKIDQELWGIDIERSTIPEYIEHHEQIKAVRTIVQDLIDKILDGSSAQQWIPCSERLPSDEDYDETFTVTIQCEHQDGWDDYVTGYADWTPHGWDIQSNYMGQIKVVAWMPSPKPWKGEA